MSELAEIQSPGEAEPVPPAASPLPPALRWAGPLLAAGFACAAGVRAWTYRAGVKKARRAPIPVISIGNLTAGGTGKTPAAAYLARGLVERGIARKPAILMRGYGAERPGEANDEARELQRTLPDTPIVVNPDRFAGALTAQAQGGDAALLDDGFQHWRLARDLDIVLLDATDPFGGGHRLPWGLLREPPQALARAGFVILTHAALAAPQDLERLRARVKDLAPHAGLAESRHAATRLRPLFSSTDEVPLTRLIGKPVMAACALGRPEVFSRTLQRAGAKVLAERFYADHYRYKDADLAALLDFAREARVEGVVVTEKDASKLERLAPPPPAATPLWALGVELKFDRGSEALWRRVEQAVGARKSNA